MISLMFARSWRKALSLITLLAASAAACSINPVSNLPEVTLLTVEQEKKIGEEEDKKVAQEMGLLDDAGLTAYLDALGQRLAKESPRQDVSYRFHVVDMIEPNAFALPGGYVYVTRGLLVLANTEDELAGVVGHEIGHVAARHTVQRVSRQGPFALITNLVSGVTGFFVPIVGDIVGGVGNLAQSLVFSPYSRSQESQADEVGQEIAAKAGWDPLGLTAFLTTLGREEALLSDGPRKPSFFDSHPATPDRVKHTTKHAKDLKAASREPISSSHEAFLARLDGLVVGQRAANGMVKGHTYLHPDLNFFVEFPQGWNVDNTPVQLVSAPKDGGKAVILRAVAQGNDPLDGARALEKASKTSIVSKTQTTTINGLQAAKTQVSDSRLTVDLTWIAYGGMIYQLAGIAETKAYDTVRPLLHGVVQSFRPLSPDERNGLREKRLRLVKAHAGETVETLTARAHSAWKANQVAVANGLQGSETLQEGQVIKIAVEEPYAGKQPR
ncbi:MAG TPA: M48 family metalloprotease [Nitrospira sp.]|nr:M48 family metalloprotease [Nitrospira sp.]